MTKENLLRKGGGKKDLVWPRANFRIEKLLWDKHAWTKEQIFPGASIPFIILDVCPLHAILMSVIGIGLHWKTEKKIP